MEAEIVVTGRLAMGKFGAVPIAHRCVTGCGRQSRMGALAACLGPIAGAYRSPTAAAGFPPAPPTAVFTQRHTRTLSFDRRPPTTGGLSRLELRRRFVSVHESIVRDVCRCRCRCCPYYYYYNIVIIPKKVSVFNSFYSL